MEMIAQAIVPIVVGAMVAGLTALAKTAYERRDERLIAHRQLELASKRTAFVSEWLEVCRSAATDDVEFAASATIRARAELEEAYEEAQQALSKGREAVNHSGSKTPGQQLGAALMLQRRRRQLSYVAVACFYLAVGFLFLLPALPEEAKFVDDEPNPDYVSRWEYLLLAVVSTIILRFVVGALVAWLEDRGVADDSASTGTEPSVPPMASFPVTEAEPQVEGVH